MKPTDQTQAVQGVKERSDRLMNYFLGGYFLTGLLFALFYDTWLVAFGVGGLCLLAYYSAKALLPASNLYQYVLSVVLGIFMAQFIYQLHGLFEMHFFAFIGSALLITYQNWRLQLPILLVVMLHHAVFGYLQNAGYTQVYFTRLDYFDLPTFMIHIVLAAIIFFICGLWAYQLKKYSEQQLRQALSLAEFQQQAQLFEERKRRDELLEERNLILESIGDAFFSVDPAWHVTYWNQTAERIMNQPRAQVLGNNLWEIFPEARDRQSYRMYHEALASGTPRHFEDFYPPTNAWYEVSAYPSAHGLSVYFKDITARKHYELELQKLNQDLSRSNSELEQFAYAASHDLQEPLRMVISFMDLLNRKYVSALDEKAQQYIYFAVDGAKRMRQIILDLLEYSRVGRQPETPQAVDLNDLIAEVQSLFKKTLHEKKAVISTEGLPTLNAEKTPLRQVFQNLISNGLKYQPAGNRPQLRITAEEHQNEWQFMVQDNGIGIAPEFTEQIFTMFKRLHVRDEYPGTGIGLAITRKIIEHLGGRIWATAAPGQGTRFHFTIPKLNP